jgi:hypothetical protein
VLSTYFVHQTARLKVSQQHVSNQSKHSFKSSRFWFFTPSPCRSSLRLGRLPVGRRIGRLSVHAGRAGRTSLRRRAATPASAAALETLPQNRRSVGRTPLAPAVLMISTRSASANSLDDPSCSNGSVVVKDLLWRC